VSSKYRTSVEDFWSFSFRPLKNNKNGCQSTVRLVSSSIPLTGYVFKSGISNIFAIEEQSGGGSDTITIPESNRESDLFGSELTTLINASSSLNGTYTVTFSSTTSKTTISCTQAFRIVWTHPALAYNFGFASTTTAYATSHEGSFAYSFSAPGHLFLRLSGLQNLDVMENVPVSANFCISTTNTSFYGSNGSPAIPLPSGGLPSTMKAELLKEDGSHYELISDWSFVLRVE
jgi:hypothetical protein